MANGRANILQCPRREERAAMGDDDQEEDDGELFRHAMRDVQPLKRPLRARSSLTPRCSRRYLQLGRRGS